jgi:hypothetical protein
MRDFRLVSDRIEDLSLTGAFASFARPVLTGERLMLSFRLPDSGMWVDTEATVARVVHGRRPGDRGRGLGVKFHDLDASSRFWLEKLLTKAPPTAPCTRPGRRDRSDQVMSLVKSSGWVRSAFGHALLRWFAK